MFHGGMKTAKRMRAVIRRKLAVWFGAAELESPGKTRL